MLSTKEKQINSRGLLTPTRLGRLFKRMLSLVVCIAIILSLFPALDSGVFEAEAVGTKGSIQTELNRVLQTYSHGTYWTASFDGGYTCYGFAKLVVYELFGKSTKKGKVYRSWRYNGDSGSGMNMVTSTTDYSAASIKNLFSQAKPGDVLQFDEVPGVANQQHSMIVWSVEEDGAVIYECNYKKENYVTKKKYAYDHNRWSNKKYKKLSLLRSDNYETLYGADTTNESSGAMNNILSASQSVAGWVASQTQKISMETMTTSKLGIDYIKSKESLKLTAYKATSKEKNYTIGYGHCGSDVSKDMKITKEQAEKYLKSDLKYFEKELKAFLKKHNRVLTQNQFDAMISFSYNVGTAWMTRTDYDIYKYIKTGKFTDKEFIECMKAWSNANGVRLAGLVKRRTEEAHMFLYGKYLNGVKSYFDPQAPEVSAGYSTGNYKINSSNGLNVRSGPGTTYSIVKTYANGKNLRIEKISGRWGQCSEGWVCLDYTKYVSSLEPVIKVPGTATLKLSTSTDIPTGGIASVSWTAVPEATSYKIMLKNSSGSAVKTVDNFKGTSTSFTIKDAGTYSISIIAKNSKYSGVETTLSSRVTAHAPSKVSFVDSGKVVSEQLVPYGGKATVPPSPSKYGFTFTGWSGSYQNVKSDQTVTAQYQRNTYTVKFFDEDGKLISSQKIKYESSAKAPNYTPNAGYEFVEWNKSFNNITKDTSVTAVVKWKDTDVQVVVSNLKAVRETDGTGVTVTYSISNQKNTITSARAIVALKTSSGKLVTTTESAAFSIKNNVSKSQEVFVPTTNASYQVEVYIVENYKTAIPISSCASAVVDQGTANWSSWSTQKPPSGAIETQSRTEYRYRDKIFKTSSSSALSGWTKYNTTWEWSSYGSWSGWSDTKITETESRDVETRQVLVKTQYRYYHYSLKTKAGNTTTTYCGKAGYNSSTASLGYSPAISEAYHTTGWLDNKLTYMGRCKWDDGWKDAYKGKSCCNTVSGTDRWFYLDSRDVYKTQYRYRDRSKVYTYHFWQWDSYTDWGTKAVTATADRQVETRTTYRYRTNEIVGTEDTTGVSYTISGDVYRSYEGKQALLMVYKVDEASDYSNQYVKQIEIGSWGAYSATFKLLEEPSIQSGDYTVTLGIIGTNEAIYLDTIEAPKPTYTVTFRDGDNIISTQTVTEGENATVPKAPEKEGYRFVYWDSTGTNIKDNVDIHAHYEKLTYTVVFINWSEETYDIHTYKHGQPLCPPALDDTDDSKVIGWDNLIDEGTGVTENMVITAKYETKQFTVKFMDWNDNVISEQTVNYGESAVEPDTLEEDDYIFFSWASEENYQCVTEDAVVVPLFSFEETVETPIVDIESGDYDSAQTVTITCPTENSVIYYTLDGSYPEGEYGIEYTGPLTIDRSCQLRVVAKAFHMNDSYEESRTIAINDDDMTSDWIAYSDIPSYVLSNLSEYNLISMAGYRYKNISLADTADNAQILEEAGWRLEKSEYSEYSSWSLNYPAVEGLIEPEIEEKDPEPEATPMYQYSHWKYYSEDQGKYVYSKVEIDEENGAWEYIKLRVPLSIAAFDGTDKVYLYDDMEWYNQTVVVEDVVPDYKMYRYRSKVSTYYMWTPWDIVVPDASETRETESADIYKYTEPEKYVVTLVGSDAFDTDILLSTANQPLEYDLAKLELNGYVFSGAYTDESYTQQWDLEKDVVTDSMNLYLKWTPEIYKVTFKGFEDAIIDVQEVEYLGYATMPEVNTPDGYVFCGFDAQSLLVTENTTISAVFVLEEDYVKVSLDEHSYALYTGTSFTLEATVTPDDAVNKDVYWISTDESIAVVDDNGRVDAKGAGTVEIKAICDETGYTDICSVTVTKNINESIILSDNASCGVDTENQIRGIKTGYNTVSEVRSLFANFGLQFVSANGEILEDEDLIGTGSKVQLLSNDEVIDEKVFVITGDMTGDGKINNRDVSMGTRYLVEKETFDICQITAMDVNGDGKVNNRDASMLSRYLVGKEQI